MFTCQTIYKFKPQYLQINLQFYNTQRQLTIMFCFIRSLISSAHSSIICFLIYLLFQNKTNFAYRETIKSLTKVHTNINNLFIYATNRNYLKIRKNCQINERFLCDPWSLSSIICIYVHSKNYTLIVIPYYTFQTSYLKTSQSNDADNFLILTTQAIIVPKGFSAITRPYKIVEVF